MERQADAKLTVWGDGPGWLAGWHKMRRVKGGRAVTNQSALRSLPKSAPQRNMVRAFVCADEIGTLSSQLNQLPRLHCNAPLCGQPSNLHGVENGTPDSDADHPVASVILVWRSIPHCAHTTIQTCCRGLRHQAKSSPGTQPHVPKTYDRVACLALHCSFSKTIPMMAKITT